MMARQKNVAWPISGSIRKAFQLTALILASASLLVPIAQAAEQQHGANGIEHPISSATGESSSIHDTSVAAADDLIAAESSQPPASEANEHKAFTSGQALRPDPLQQMAASVAPNFAVPSQGQQIPQAGSPIQQQQAGQQAPMSPFALNPHQMAALRQHQQHQKQALNPFIAAALAGNYGPAQQQMAAASLQHQRIAPVPQMAHSGHPQQLGGHHHHPNVAAHHQIPQQNPIHMIHAHSPQMMHPQAGQQAFPSSPQPVRDQSDPSSRVNLNPNQAIGNQIGDETSEDNGPNNGQGMSMMASGQHPQVLPSVSGSQTELTGAASSTSTAVVQQQNSWPLQAPDVPKITNLEVKCEKNLMKVSIEFDKIFNGVIFSKGHYSQGQCVHVGANSGKQQAYFDISINSCGTQGNTQNGLYGMGGNTGSGTFFENTIVIQYDPNVQEVYDHARKLRCTWHDQYEKAVTFRPFPVDMLDIVRADFAGDNVGCWMQIQVGKGPWASEVAGIVKIGQTMTMVLAIKDEENKFDMLVRNCFAHDGKRGPIELVDKTGCITRPKLMSRFTKIKNFGSSATVLSYAHFQAFKFPDSMEVHFQCTIQICRHQCPEQCSASGANALGGPNGESYSESTISGTLNINGAQQDGAPVHLRKYGQSSNGGLTRERRDLRSHRQHRFANESTPLNKMVGVNRIIQVVSSGDLAFAIQQQQQQQQANGSQSEYSDPNAEQLTRVDLSNQICMSSYNFVLSVVVLVLLLLCSSLLAISLYWRQVRLSRSSSSSKLVPGSHASSPASTLRHPQLNQVPISHHHSLSDHSQHQSLDRRFA